MPDNSAQPLSIVTWNVNGIRAAMDKGFRDFVESETPDILCLQETKAHPDQVNLNWVAPLGYHQIWNPARKKGYSGTVIWSRPKPLDHRLGLGKAEHDHEGRVVTATYETFELVNVYTPNAQRGLKRLDYRQQWDREFLSFVEHRNRDRPVIFCGDINCAHQEIDLANPRANRKNAGFSEEERAGIDRMIEAGFVDAFRSFDDRPDQYSWWTYRLDARSRNVGWRLDYFFVAQPLMDRVTEVNMRQDIFGSDHCPVELKLIPG